MTKKQTTRKTKQSNNVTRFALSLLVLRPDMPLGLVVVLPIRDPAFFWPLRLPINRCSGYPTSRHSRCKSSGGLKTVRCHGVSVPRAPGVWRPPDRVVGQWREDLVKLLGLCGRDVAFHAVPVCARCGSQQVAKGLCLWRHGWHVGIVDRRRQTNCCDRDGFLFT